MLKYLPHLGVSLVGLVTVFLLSRPPMARVEAQSSPIPPVTGRADMIASGALNDTKKIISLPMQGFQGASCVLNGSWKANVDFWISCDDRKSWQRAMVYWEQQDGRIVDSAGSNTNGTYRWADLGGVSHVGVQLGTYDSGEVKVLLRTTTAAGHIAMTVAREGVMGPQTPAMHIIGGPDAGGQIPHAVRVTNQPVGASAYGLNVRPVPNSFQHINRNAHTTVKSGAGILHALTINSAGAGWSITVYDSTTGGGSVLAVIKPVAGSTLRYDVGFANGCTLVTSGGAPGDITVSFQ